MNFSTKLYDINFVKIYNKMTNFTNHNERKKWHFIPQKNLKDFYLLKLI